MLVSSGSAPHEIADLASAYSKPQMEIVTAARQAHYATEASASLETASKAAIIKGLAKQMTGAAKAVEFGARSLGCRMNMRVDALPPHLPILTAGFGGHPEVLMRCRVISEFI